MIHGYHVILPHDGFWLLYDIWSLSGRFTRKKGFSQLFGASA